MTVSRIKVRIPTRFPSSVSVSDPLTLDRTGGAFAFALDVSLLNASLGLVYQPLETTLTALAAIGSTAGLLTQTAADTFAQRTITGTANEITATNGSGAAGNPTLSLPAALTFTGKTVTGGAFSGITITTSTFNGNTWTAGTGVLTLGAGKTGTISNTLTFTGTDGSTAAFGTGGTVAYVANKLSAFAATTSLELKGVISDETGSGALVFGTTPTLNQPNIVGTTTNDSAAAGSVGEVISSNIAVGSAVSLTTGAAANITSISLTAGDWDVYGDVAFNPAGGTTMSSLSGWISSVSAAFPTIPNSGSLFSLALTFTTGVAQIFPIGRTRISVASTTTIYLSCQASFGGSTLGGYGFIGARRVR